jgi:hypothetical protein
MRHFEKQWRSSFLASQKRLSAALISSAAKTASGSAPVCFQGMYIVDVIEHRRIQRQELPPRNVGGSKGFAPVPLQAVEQQGSERAVSGGQEGKDSEAPVETKIG